MHWKSAVLILFPFLFNPLLAQPESSDSTYWAEEIGISDAMQLFIQYNSMNPTSKGFRIQIFNGTKQNANRKKSEFLQKYPSMVAHMIYEYPEYRIQIGDYKTKYEAERSLSEIREWFPGSFIINTQIGQRLR